MTGRAGESTVARPVGPAGLPTRRTVRALLFGSTGSLLNQFARYLVVGGVAFAVDFGSLYLFVEFVGLHYLIAAAVAFLFGLVTNYCLSRLWVFDRRTLQSATAEFLIFAVIGVIGLGLNEVIIWFVREHIHFHYMVAKAISAGIVLIWNFGARKAVLFG